MLNLKQLEEAFSSLAQFNKKEDTFLVGNIPVTVRHISDEEEVTLIKYASLAFEEGVEDKATELSFVHRMKICLLSMAIVQIGNVNLRDDLVLTGDMTPKGEPVKRERAEVVRKLLAKWPSPYLIRMFAKYGELMTKLSLEAEKQIQFEPVDLDAEIQRLEARKQELIATKQKYEKSLSSATSNYIRDAISRASEMDEATRRNPSDPEEDDGMVFTHNTSAEEYYENVPQPPPQAYSQPPSQSFSPAPSQPQNHPPRPSYDPATVMQGRTPLQNPLAQIPESGEAIRKDQMYSPMEAMTRDDQQRAAAARRAKSDANNPEMDPRYQGVSAHPVQARRPAPHMQAQAAAQAAFGDSQEYSTAKGLSQVTGYQIDPNTGQQIPVFGGETQELSPRNMPRQNVSPSAPVSANKIPNAPNNPRFKPRR